MKRSFAIALLFSLMISGCAAEKQPTEEPLSKGNILFDFGINSISSIEKAEMYFYDASQLTVPIENLEDLVFLKYYTYKGEYPFNQLHQLSVFPGLPRLFLYKGNISLRLFVFDDGSIVIQNYPDGDLFVYTADEEHIKTSKNIYELKDKYK